MSDRADFVHLHLHSEYSLLDGAIRFDRLAKYLNENDMSAVAVTDHGSLFGAVQFFDKMKAGGIHPILGMEAYIAHPSMDDRSRDGKRYHLTLLARNEEGYHNLSRLSSAGYIDGFYYKPRIDRSILEKHSQGLLIGSACLQGEVARHLLGGRREKALETVRYYQDLVGRIKNRFPHIKFYLHSHGQIMDLVPDLIDCGVDVLNPILPLDHMDAVQLKRAYGDELCFHGGVDVEHIMIFGTVDEVRDHVKQVIDTLAPGGGYWFKAQVISPVIPPENVIAAYELAIEYGQYDRGLDG